MIKKFLNVKPLPLFVLIFALPVLLLIAEIASDISSYNNNSNQNTPMTYDFENIASLFRLIATAIFFIWIWSVVVGLQKKIPENIEMKIGRFKFFFFTPIILLLSFYIIIILRLDNFMTPNTAFAFLLFGTVLMIILFVLICVLQTIYFAAKTLKTVELQREVKFGDFSSEFFLMVFIPIGIWSIQPRVNRIASYKK